jgi:hypothetical protein
MCCLRNYCEIAAFIQLNKLFFATAICDGATVASQVLSALMPGSGPAISIHSLKT